MYTTIKELLITYKLFDKVITFQELLNVEFDEGYLLIELNVHGTECTPIFFDSNTQLYLISYNPEDYNYVFDDRFVLIKPNLYSSSHLGIPEGT